MKLEGAWIEWFVLVGRNGSQIILVHAHRVCTWIFLASARTARLLVAIVQESISAPHVTQIIKLLMEHVNVRAMSMC